MFWNVFSHFSSAEITYNSVNNFDEVNPYGILFYEHRKIFIRKINSKEYHKVRDFVKVFPKLDTQTLKVTFPDFDYLITALRS